MVLNSKDKLEIIAFITSIFLNMIHRQVCELQGVSTNFWITPRTNKKYARYIKLIYLIEASKLLLI